jgi:hypothetical protein
MYLLLFWGRYTTKETQFVKKKQVKFMFKGLLGFGVSKEILKGCVETAFLREFEQYKNYGLRCRVLRVVLTLGRREKAADFTASLYCDVYIRERRGEAVFRRSSLYNPGTQVTGFLNGLYKPHLPLRYNGNYIGIIWNYRINKGTWGKNGI